MSGGTLGTGASSSQLDIDRMYMERALELAAQARGKTSPNPCVGCVIVKDGSVIGEGFHEKAGEPHAEVHALLRAGDEAKGATAYVSLEPCNHFGRTPPCTHALLRHGVSRVVAGMVDPDPRVSGCGLQYLRDEGAVVDVIQDSELNGACKALNAPFVFRVMYKRAYAVVWSAFDAARGALCDPLSALDLLDVHPVLTDINAVVLSASRFVKLDTQSVAHWPSHLPIAVDLGDNQAYEALLSVREHIARIVEHTQQDGNNISPPRRWFVLNSISNSDESTSVSRAVGELDRELNVEYSCYGVGDLTDGSKPIDDDSLRQSMLKTLATLGCNSVLLMADTYEELMHLRQCDALQRLVLTETPVSVTATASTTESSLSFQEQATKFISACGLTMPSALACTKNSNLLSRLSGATYEEHDTVPNEYRINALTLRLWKQD